MEALVGWASEIRWAEILHIFKLEFRLAEIDKFSGINGGCLNLVKLYAAENQIQTGGIRSVN